MLPKKLGGANMLVDGVSYHGQVYFTPPIIAATVEEISMPGHGGKLDILTGHIEKMEAEVEVMDASEALSGFVANPESRQASVEFLTHVTSNDGSKNERWVVRGVWTKQERGEVNDDKNVSTKYSITVDILTHFINGVEQRHIDVEQAIHRIKGRDVNALLRDGLQI